MYIQALCRTLKIGELRGCELVVVKLESNYGRELSNRVKTTYESLERCNAESHHHIDHMGNDYFEEDGNNNYDDYNDYNDYDDYDDYNDYDYTRSTGPTQTQSELALPTINSDSFA